MSKYLFVKYVWRRCRDLILDKNPQFSWRQWEHQEKSVMRGDNKAEIWTQHLEIWSKRATD
jgi:hypothetical protein